jgi:hypothetical protein
VSGNYPPSNISGGSANSFDRHLSAAKLQELLDEMKRQGMEISLLKQQLAEVSPTNDGQAERSAKEAEAQRRRAEAFRKQLWRLRSAAESGPSGPLENFRRPEPGSVETIVISTKMIAEENKTNQMAVERAPGLGSDQNASRPSRLDAPLSWSNPGKRSRSGC